MHVHVCIKVTRTLSEMYLAMYYACMHIRWTYFTFTECTEWIDSDALCRGALISLHFLIECLQHGRGMKHFTVRYTETLEQTLLWPCRHFWPWKWKNRWMYTHDSWSMHSQHTTCRISHSALINISYACINMHNILHACIIIYMYWANAYTCSETHRATGSIQSERYRAVSLRAVHFLTMSNRRLRKPSTGREYS